MTPAPKLRVTTAHRLSGVVAFFAAIGSLSCVVPDPALPVRPHGAAAARSEPPPQVESDLVQSLVTLGYAALEDGDAAAAEGRFLRALAVAPNASRPRTGLGRAALLRGDSARAQGLFEQVAAADQSAVGARIALAGLVRRLDPARARALLSEAYTVDPLDPVAAAAYAEVTGPAPRHPAPIDVASARDRAAAHPFDLFAAVAWAELALAEAAGSADAKAALEAVSERLFVADLDVASAWRGIELLRAHESAWADRRVVWVHSWADETVRRHVGWRMRLRGLWRGQNEALEPVLGTVYLPATLGEFLAPTASPQLARVHEAWLRDVHSWPSEGILSAFTERPGPKLSGYRLGVAELSGRRLVVRLAPGERDSRTLTHEVLHLYGAVHVRAEVDSLMNPSGDSVTLDRGNHRIAVLLRDRKFRGRGLEVDSFPFVDVDALTSAYEQVLRVNLAFRALGLDRVLEARETSRYYAANLARKEVALDAHFADVASLVGNLLLHQQRLIEAAFFFDGAARLYGPDTRAGAARRERFEEIYRVLKARGEVR